VEAALVSNRIGLGVCAAGVVALPVVVVLGVLVVFLGVGSGAGEVVCVGLNVLPEGVGTTEGSLGGLTACAPEGVLEGSPSVDPLLPLGVVGTGVGVTAGVLSVEPGVVVVGGATSATSTCGGGLVGV
jgi:hypothetical protein